MKKILLMIIAAIILFTVSFICMGLIFSEQNGVLEKERNKEREGSAFPIIYIESNSMQYNPIHGYVRPMNINTIEHSLTLINNNKKIDIYIKEGVDIVDGAEYSIYNADTLELLYKADATNGMKGDGEGGRVASLSFMEGIELVDNREFIVEIVLKFGFNQVYYYTRAIYSTQNYVISHINYAKEFHKKTFNIEYAEELSKRLETKKGYKWNESYNKTGIYDPVEALMWKNFEIEMLTEPMPYVKLVSARETFVELRYVARGIDTDRVYIIKESYLLNTNKTNTYLMEYERTVDSIFDIDSFDYKNKQLNLDVIATESFESKTSPNGKFVAFYVTGQLWLYDLEKGIVTNIYGITLEDEDYERELYNQHGVDIVSVDDTGDVIFNVIGYINWGAYEGENGILINRYSYTVNEISKMVYIPIKDGYKYIEKMGISDCYSKGEKMYLVYVDTIYSIDFSTGICEVLARGINQYGFSTSKKILVWQETDDVYTNETLNILEVESGEVMKYRAQKGDSLEFVGFINEDIVCAFGEKGKIIGADTEELIFPIDTIELINAKLEVLMSYSKENINFFKPEIVDNRVFFDIGTVESGKVKKDSSDFIIVNTSIEIASNGVLTSKNEYGNLVAYYPLKIKKTSEPKELIPNQGGRLANETNDVIENSREYEYYVFLKCKLMEVFTEEEEAIELAKELGGKLYK